MTQKTIDKNREYLKEHYFKTYSDSSLMSMTKKELIELLRICEDNLATIHSCYAATVDYNSKLQKQLDEYSSEEDYGYDDDYDHCYECTGYGDDYYENESGELVSACDDCAYNSSNWNDGYWKDDY